MLASKPSPHMLQVSLTGRCQTWQHPCSPAGLQHAASTHTASPSTALAWWRWQRSIGGCSRRCRAVCKMLLLLQRHTPAQQVKAPFAAASSGSKSFLTLQDCRILDAVLWPLLLFLAIIVFTQRWCGQWRAMHLPLLLLTGCSSCSAAGLKQDPCLAPAIQEHCTIYDGRVQPCSAVLACCCLELHNCSRDG